MRTDRQTDRQTNCIHNKVAPARQDAKPAPSNILQREASVCNVRHLEFSKFEMFDDRRSMRMRSDYERSYKISRKSDKYLWRK